MYEIFVLPPDTFDGVDSLEVFLSGEEERILKGSYRFGTFGSEADLEIRGDGWSGGLRLTDASGISGEIKRVEDLQDFKLFVRRGDLYAEGGIMTENTLMGRVKGEGVNLTYGGVRGGYLYRYAPNRRKSLVLTEGYVGPYRFSETPVLRRSLRVYVNGRPLDTREWKISEDGGAIYILSSFRDGDVLTVEFQGSEISPSHVVMGGVTLAAFTFEVYGETPAAEILNGCVRNDRGDYSIKGDTFLFVPGRGDYSCNFARKEGGDYVFVGDRYIPSEDGEYVLIPPDTSPRTFISSLNFADGGNRFSLKAGKTGEDRLYDALWDFKLGEGLFLRTHGQIHTETSPFVREYKGSRWMENRGVFSVGAGFKSGDFFSEMDLYLSPGDSLQRGFEMRGFWRFVGGRYGRFPNNEEKEVYVKWGEHTVSYVEYGDTSISYRGVRWETPGFDGNLKRYADGFLGYSVNYLGEVLRIGYAKTPSGASLISNLVYTYRELTLRGDVRSAQRFYKQVRFVYVGKGWGDYERDSSGKFVPFPYGSYRKEVLYFPEDERSYDVELSVGYRRFRTSLSTQLSRGVERYNLFLTLSGGSPAHHSINLLLSEDRRSNLSEVRRNLRVYLERGVFLDVEYRFEMLSGLRVEYWSVFPGYTLGWIGGGVEMLRAASYALSPTALFRRTLSARVGYRFYTGDVGREVVYKPQGFFADFGLFLKREVAGVHLQGSLFGGYDARRNLYYNFSFSVGGEI